MENQRKSLVLLPDTYTYKSGSNVKKKKRTDHQVPPIHTLASYFREDCCPYLSSFPLGQITTVRIKGDEKHNKTERNEKIFFNHAH